MDEHLLNPRYDSTACRLRPSGVRHYAALVGLLSGLALLPLGGCGTSRWTNSPRTGTEMLLISDAIDQAVDRMDFSPLAGEPVYFDPQYLAGTLDQGYIVSSIRQKLLASGCILKESREEARFIVEARSGGVGTDQNDVTFGIPSVNVPPLLGAATAGVPASIPEVPLIKKTKQKGIAKLAVFAYERATGRAVWQSGAEPINSTAQDTWVFGAGPFQRGSIYRGTKFAGSKLPVPILPGQPSEGDEHDQLQVVDQAVFLDPTATENSAVRLTGHEQPVGSRPAASGSR